MLSDIQLHVSLAPVDESSTDSEVCWHVKRLNQCNKIQRFQMRWQAAMHVVELKACVQSAVFASHVHFRAVFEPISNK